MWELSLARRDQGPGCHHESAIIRWEPAIETTLQSFYHHSVLFACVQERRWKFPLGAHENLAGALSRQGVQVGRYSLFVLQTFRS